MNTRNTYPDEGIYPDEGSMAPMSQSGQTPQDPIDINSVTGSLNELSDSAFCLVERLHKLNDMLDPIMTQGLKEGDERKADAIPSAGYCAVSCRVHDARATVERASGLVRNIMNNLNL